jgi:hypothetical protein
MLETFTPAVCGSRRRQRVAVALFTASAVLAAALLGAALGLVGALVGARGVVAAAGALALLAAGREAGLVRFPLPQARRQVPERWRFELPLPVWASGYGAGLGVGVFTFQPVSTFWVACAGALALARPLPAAVCFSVYGAGRAASVLWARARAADAGDAVERLAGRRRGLLRANAVALAACAALLFLAPATGAAPKRVAYSSLDPTVGTNVIAYARQSGSVVVRPSHPIVYVRARTPSLDGGLLAYRDARGIRIVRWQRPRRIVRRVNGQVSMPALDWPFLAFRWHKAGRRHLMLRNLRTGFQRRIASYRSVDLGRPSLRSGRLAWHVASRNGSTIYLQRLSTRKRWRIASSRVNRLSNPSLSHWRILWVQESSGEARLQLRSISGGRSRTIAMVPNRRLSYWTTALGPGTAYWTRWSLATRGARIYKLRY